jgi:hypothetical protein
MRKRRGGLRLRLVHHGEIGPVLPTDDRNYEGFTN